MREEIQSICIYPHLQTGCGLEPFPTSELFNNREMLTGILTENLTSWSRVLLQKLIVYSAKEKFATFYGN
jgi:hypothetical protein